MKALIATSIDSHVDTSLNWLSDGNTHVIHTTTGTLDFRKAVDEDLEATAYEAYKKSFTDFVIQYRERYVRHANRVSAEKVAENLINHFDRSIKRSVIAVEKATYSYQSNSLASHDAMRDDTCDVQYDIIPKTNNVTCIGLQHLSGSEFYNMGDIQVRVENDEGLAIPCTTFALPPEFMNNSLEKNNLVLQFDSPLEVDRRYRFQYQTLASEVLYDLDAAAKKKTKFIFRLSMLIP